MADTGKRSADEAALGGPEPAAKFGRFNGDAGLPPDVQDKLQGIIDSGVVFEGELDNRALSQLAGFHPATAIEILDEFAGSDMRHVRNKSAYLAGVMGRFRKYGSNARLHIDIQSRLDRLFKVGMLQPGQLDARCIDALQTLPLPIAVRAIDRFASRDLSEIRNVSAFIMSNVKAAAQERDDPSEFAEPDYTLLAPPPPPPRTRPAHHAGAGPAASVAYGPTSALTVGQTPVPVSARKNYATEQTKMGVRTDEFHSLSVFAVYVHPAPALKLQQLWDDGNPLVSLLDDQAWEVLAELGAPEALAVIEETAAQVDDSQPASRISGIFAGIAQRFRPRRQPMVSVAAAPPPTVRPYHGSQRFMPDSAPPPSGYHGPGGYPGAGYEVDAYGDVYDAPDWHESNGFGRGRGEGYGPRGEGRLRGDTYRGDNYKGDGYRERERGPGNIADLPLAVQQKCEEVLQTQSHFIGRHHFDEGVVDLLKRLAEADAVHVLNELAANDLTTVRNVPAYIMGICRRYSQPYRRR